MLTNVKGWGKVVREGNSVRLKINGRFAFEKQMDDFLLRGKDSAEVKFVVSLDLEPKTTKQLRYYFGVVCVYAAIGFERGGWNGIDREGADFLLRTMFFSETKTHPGTGEVKEFPKSLSAASKYEVSELINKSIVFTESDLGVPVPASYDKNFDA